MLSTADVNHAGLRSRDVARLVGDGTLVRVAPRAYVLSEALSRARTPEQQHRLVAMAVAHSCGTVVVRLVSDDLDHPARARAMIRQGLRQVEDLPLVA